MPNNAQNGTKEPPTRVKGFGRRGLTSPLQRTMTNADKQILFLKELFDSDMESLREEYSQFFARFVKKIGDFQWRLGIIKSAFDAANARGKVVIDIGCGFGFAAMIFGILGSKRVIGVDCDREKIEIFTKLLDRIEPKLNNVEINFRDALNLPYSDSSVDAVMANEVISHVRDFDRFVSEVRRVLRTGGVLYIDDGNNTLDLRGSRRRKRQCERRERGPVDTSELRATDVPLSFQEIRKNMIAARFPQLGESKLLELAEATQGLWGDEVIRAAHNLLQAKPLGYEPIFPYKNPVTGEYIELEFNPFKLRKRLEQSGFRAEILPPAVYNHYPTSIRKKFANVMKKLIGVAPSVTPFVLPYFRIRAVKMNAK